MNQELAANFGTVIRELRKEKKLSQEELSFKAGVHRTYIGMIERGEKNIALENIQKLAIALETPMTTIFSNLEKSLK
jgi:transcriptional regulator with XRE-family HTH domain